MSTATQGRAREHKPVPGFPLYEVSNDGEVRSWVPWKGTPVPRVLKQQENPAGYRIVFIGGKAKTVHRLMALAFLDGPASEVVRHLNDDKLDNRVENLAWGTRSDNGRDAVRNGKHYLASLTHCPLRGHPLSGANLYVTPRGKRACRECIRIRKAQRKAAA